VCLMLVGFSTQLGTLYLDSIQGNLDPITGLTEVRIEGTIWDETEVTLDFIEGRESPGTGPGYGVNIEDSIHNEGSWFIPEDLLVEGTMTVEGLLKPNGGIICDDGDPDDDGTHSFEYSWRLFDDSGDLHVLGAFFPNGGLNMDHQFWVENDTGRTHIQGLTRPDGGIDVNGSEFVVEGNTGANTGEITSEGHLSVEKDVFFGTILEETRTIGRPDLGVSNPTFAQPTLFLGQHGRVTGGNIVLSPGVATGLESTTSHGRLVLGVPNRPTEPFNVARFPVDDTDGVTDGGATILSGQDSVGRGGDFVLQAGHGTSGDGGNLVIATGEAPDEIDYGTIILGGASFPGDHNQREDFDYVATRPPIRESRDAGDTFIRGQSTSNSNCQELLFIGGDGSTGSSAGSVVVAPGFTEETQQQGTLFFGRPDDIGDAITMSRQSPPVPGDAGDTFVVAQSSILADGGDLFLQAGSSGVAGTAGSIFLETGLAAPTPNGGDIFWGQAGDDLVVHRVVAATTAASTTSILGQPSNAGNGGDLVINSGAGTLGGDINLFAADSVVNGGSVNINAATGSTNGGAVVVTAGDGAASHGGWITVRAGASGVTSTTGADVTFTAGTGTGGIPGSVFFNSNGVLRLDAVDFVQNTAIGQDFSIVAGVNQLDIGAVPSSFFFNIGGEGVLTSRLSASANIRELPGSLGTAEPANAIGELAAFYTDLVALLGPAGQGLINAPVLPPSPRAVCADIVTNMDVWGFTSTGVDLRAWTGSSLHYIGCPGDGCAPSSFFCTDTATTLSFGTTSTSAMRSAVDVGNVRGDDWPAPSDFTGCCSANLGLCNSPDQPLDATALCIALGYSSGTVVAISSNSCPESHSTDATGLNWSSDFASSFGFGQSYSCVL